jgi:hypothetical protein
MGVQIKFNVVTIADGLVVCRRQFITEIDTLKAVNVV